MTPSSLAAHGAAPAPRPGALPVRAGGLLAARTQFDKGQADAAKASLAWVAGHAVEEEMRTVARLRLAALQAEAKQYDEALRPCPRPLSSAACTVAGAMSST